MISSDLNHTSVSTKPYINDVLALIALLVVWACTAW